MYGNNKNSEGKSSLLDAFIRLINIIKVIVEANLTVICFSVIIFLFIILSTGNLYITSFFNILTLNDLTNKLQLFGGFNILVILTILGIGIYCLYLLFFIQKNGIFQFVGTELNENKYTSTVYFITNILYVISFWPLIYYLIINLNNSFIINLIQILLIFFALLFYFISKRHLTDILFISEKSGKPPCIYNYDFIEKVRKSESIEKDNNEKGKKTLYALLKLKVTQLFYIIFLFNLDDKFVENMNAKIAKSSYSHVTFNFMILFCVLGVLFQFNLLTLVFIELTLLYIYLFLSTLEITPKYRYNISFSLKDIGENGKCEKAYFFKVNDYYIIITKGKKPFWVNGTAVLTLVPSDVY